MQWTAAEMDGMRCNGLLWLCKFMVFSCWMQTSTPNPSALILSVKFCDQDTGTNLHHKKEKKDSQRSKCLPVLFGAICHVLVFVMFLLAANLSLPELVLVRTYTL